MGIVVGASGTILKTTNAVVVPPLRLETERHQILKHFILFQNYPNPFNSSTTIEFALPKAEYVTLTVYNIRGEEMAILMDGNLPSGKHKSEWNASGFASGVYFYTLRTKSFFEPKKLIIIK